MTAPHVNLRDFLRIFIAEHPGLRFAKMFGSPAGYAGRRLFACLTDDGIIVRLPGHVALEEIKKGGRPFSPRGGRWSGRWIIYQPKTAAAARKLLPLLELSAREAAESHGSA